jgi:hypothetical protein
MACSRRPVTLETNRRGPETPAVSYVSAVSQAQRAVGSLLRVVVLVVHRSEFVTEIYRSKSNFAAERPAGAFEGSIGHKVGTPSDHGYEG